VGHLDLIVSDKSYAAVSADMPWNNHANPGRGTVIPETVYQTQLNAVQHQWEEDYNTFKTFCNVVKALKTQIIMVF
jgi:hypothetical protein